MAVLSFNIKGLDATLKGVDNKLKEVERELQDELNAWALLCSAEAKIRAPKDKGHLAGAINPKFETLAASVTVAVFYAAYVEFGTGLYARKHLPSLPKDWVDYAKNFYVNGEGRIRAHPYLFPAYEHTINDLKKNLKSLFK